MGLCTSSCEYVDAVEYKLKSSLLSHYCDQCFTETIQHIIVQLQEKTDADLLVFWL